MIKQALASAFLLVALAMALAGCGGDPTPGPIASETQGTVGSSATDSVVRIIARDNVFEPATYSVQGPAFRIAIVNEGHNMHEVEVKGLIVETTLAPGQSKSIDITGARPGTYKVYCEIHEDEGMEGELIVK